MMTVPAPPNNCHMETPGRNDKSTTNSRYCTFIKTAWNLHTCPGELKPFPVLQLWEQMALFFKGVIFFF